MTHLPSLNLATRCLVFPRIQSFALHPHDENFTPATDPPPSSSARSPLHHHQRSSGGRYSLRTRLAPSPRQSRYKSWSHWHAIRANESRVPPKQVVVRVDFYFSYARVKRICDLASSVFCASVLLSTREYQQPLPAKDDEGNKVTGIIRAGLGPRMKMTPSLRTSELLRPEVIFYF